MPRLTERTQITRQGRAIQARQFRDAGWSLRAIARKLGVSEWTVRDDLKRCEASARFEAPRTVKPRTNLAAQTAEVIPFRRQA